MDVTEKYKNMISAFSCDFNLAKDNVKHFSIDNLIEGDCKGILANIDLLAELEFKIRRNQIVIMEVGE